MGYILTYSYHIVAIKEWLGEIWAYFLFNCVSGTVLYRYQLFNFPSNLQGFDQVRFVDEVK